MGLETAPPDERELPVPGRLIQLSDPGYGAERLPRHWLIERRPAAMLQCRNTAGECAASPARE
jgi:hypothetical protein